MLNEHFPGSAHVLDIELDTAGDHRLWKHAREHGFTLLTCDGDFERICKLNGAPPKVVWVRNADMSAREQALGVMAQMVRILAFVRESEGALLIISL